ncbi:DUF4288 domain-containing protein [Corynebacterium sp. MSK195]|uniref:DUF4288 domain-containing protein n=1 Tax=Corynebacterium sp. MSK195 TaxID=3050216 RepID=UPI00254F2662|nr:DUF4288 domain-containing protein [Corynebacterium sp. MSK195]MDK8671261.1 DUF4288 domain-containing protein [Corynebacterium sp. MSK195]
MEPYVGIAVFELASQSSEHSNFFREDFFLVYADSDEEAHRKVEARAHEQEYEGLWLRHIVDVAPALYGHVDRDCDLYSRHFSALEDYERFEMNLGGKDPLSPPK